LKTNTIDPVSILDARLADVDPQKLLDVMGQAADEPPFYNCFINRHVGFAEEAERSEEQKDAARR
jgi:hypothetical protein